MTLNFDQHVCCTETPNGDRWECRMSEQDPYKCALYIFYRRTTTRLYIIGSIAWEQLEQMGGCINVKTDLQQSRYHVPKWLDAQQELVETPIEMFWLPVTLPRKFVGPRVTYDVIEKRLLWCITNRSLSFNANDEVAGVYALSFIENAMSRLECVEYPVVHEKRREFHERRMQKEKQRLEQLFAPFKTEVQIFDLLKFNGLADYMKDVMVKYATAQDRILFLRRWPHLRPPICVFRVAMAESPFPSLPVQEYGIVHLCYPDVQHWVWHLFCIEQKRLATIHTCDSQMIREAAKVVLCTPIEEKSRKKQRLQEDANIIDPLVAAPHWIVPLMVAPEFPKHKERLKILFSLRDRGVPKEVVFKWFEDKNAQFPHPGHKNTLARFNYESAWEYHK